MVDFEDFNPSEVFDLSLNANHSVCLANSFVHGRYSLSLTEMRLFLLAISQIKPEHERTLYTYQASLTDLASFLGVAPSNLSRDLKSVCSNLVGQVVYIEDGKDWEMFHLVSYAKYKTGDGVLTLRLSNEIMPYAVGLKKYYTSVLLGDILKFSCKYSSPLFLRLKSDIGFSQYTKYEFNFSVSDIRSMFRIPDKKYKKAYDLLNYTVVPALNEISKSDFAYIWDYEEIRSRKRGHPIEGVSFKMVLFDNRQIKDRFLELYSSENVPPYFLIARIKKELS